MDRVANPERDVGVAVPECIPEYGADVVVLGLEPVEPNGRARGFQLGLRELRELEEIRAVPASQVFRVAALLVCAPETGWQ